jgi:hypothetical protein
VSAFQLAIVRSRSVDKVKNAEMKTATSKFECVAAVRCHHVINLEIRAYLLSVESDHYVRMPSHIRQIFMEDP